MVDLSIDEFSDPTTTLLTLARKFITLLTSKEALAIHKICAFEAQTSPQLSELFYQAGPERLAAAVEMLLQNFHDKKLLQLQNTHFAAWQFLNLMRGEIVMRLEFQTKKQISATEIDEYLSASVALFVRGYSASK
jgi:TetR/AcrR family transcriptional repressor of mexJK operon